MEITRKYYAKKKNKRKEKKITLHHQYENEEQQPTAGRGYGSMVIPGVVVSVEDDGSTQAASWVDTSSCDGNSRQMHQVNCKSNGKGRKHLQCSNTTIHDS